MSTESSEINAPTEGRVLPPEGSFGRIVLDLGFMTIDQLDAAIAAQQERQGRGDFARLGHILVERGDLTPSQVQEVLEAQKIVILTCSGCEARYNIRGYSPRFHYECPRCHSELVPGQVQSVAVEDQLQVKHTDTHALLTRPDEESSNTAKIRMLKRLGKYEILGEIARGGMGIIYKARQPDLERIVAVKTLRQEELTKPESAEQFIQEAHALAQLRHPSIIGVHEVGTFRGIQYFTMDFIEGLSLDRLLLRAPLEPRRAVEVVLAIADALEYAHRRGVVHRDLKPANIIVASEDGSPFLVDFGIAKKIATDGPRQLYDEEEDLLGSIPYMAPEYVEGAAYDELCDLYSLGVVLYESLAGANALPYFDDDTRKFLEKIITCDFRPIAEWVPGLDPDLVAIVERMICERERRYPSMNAAVRALRRWLVANDTATPVTGYRLPRPAGHPAALPAGAAPPAAAPEEVMAAVPDPSALDEGTSTPDPDIEAPAREAASEGSEATTREAAASEAAASEAAASEAAAASQPAAPVAEAAAMAAKEAATARTESAAEPAPGQALEARSAKPLALLLMAALGAVAWTAHQVEGLKHDLELERQSQRLRDQEQRERVLQLQVQHAASLRDLGHADRALSYCDAIIASAPNPGDPALSGAFQLRGELKRELNKPGAEEDLERAKRLRR
ncbi:MAG: serine/threonine protein kinase [Planctomycetota bacterium]